MATRVSALASLARISVPEERIPTLEKEFDALLAYIDQLQSLTTADTLHGQKPSSRNIFREDINEAAVPATRESLLNAFPKREGDSLAVRTVISHDA